MKVTADDLLNTQIADAKITLAGFSNNIDVALQYIESWLRGVGAAAIYNLMEDAATAEIARAQLWQWVHIGAKLEDGTQITDKLYKQVRDKVLEQFDTAAPHRFTEAVEILDDMVLKNDFTEFLTIPAYKFLSN